MKILLCNERFLFRFGVDRVLMILGKYFREMGHTVVMMGNKLDERAVESCTDDFIKVPEAPEYINSNEFAYTWLQENWEVFFPKGQEPDAAIIAGWPFYCSIKFLAEKCKTAVFQDHGAVPLDGMDGGQLITQQKLRRLRSENLPYADKIIAISKFLEDSQSIPDSAGIAGTCCILHGADHMELGLWTNTTLDMKESDDLKRFEDYKRNGVKLLLLLGRFETGGYKNSESCFSVLREIRNSNINAKFLILAKQDDVIIPNDLAEDIIPLGYVSDDLLQKLMEICDVGVSFSLWEGFNLPIAEMQLLNRPVYVYNIGAHPEVVLDKHYLCENEQDLIQKIINELNGQSPISSDRRLQCLQKFKDYFKWRRSAISHLEVLFNQIYRKNNVKILIDVTNACHDTANSGVMRVTRQISRNVQNIVPEVIFVSWDDSINKYVFPYDGEVDLLCAYNGPDGSKIKYRSIDGHARSLLDDALEKDKKYVLFITETINESHAKIIRNYARSLDIGLAAVFYDAIAVKHSEYCSEQVVENHSRYMKGLAECDVVVPIAEANTVDLKEFWLQEGVTPTDVITDMLPGEFQGAERCTKVSSHDGDKKVSILCVSTLEPRKNHKTVIDALSIFANNNPNIDWEFLMVGNKYAGREDIYDYVVSACQKEPRIKYLGVVDDKKLIELYQSCTFTIYSSIVEGFGMPIMESLWHGKVCLCAEWGVMNELASGGGCYTVDVKSPEKIADGIKELATNIPLRQKLEQEAVSRHIRTWQDYSLSLLDIVSKAVFKRERASSLSKFIFSDGKPAPVDLTEFLQEVKPESAVVIGKSQSVNIIKEYCPIVFNIIPDSVNAVEEDLVGDYRQILPVIEEELCFRGLSLGLIYLTADVDYEQALNFINNYNFDRDLFVYIEVFNKSVNNLKIENINIHLIY